MPIKKVQVRYININYQALSFFKVITHVLWIIVYIFFNIQKHTMKPLNTFTNSQSKKILFLLELQNPFYLYGVASVSIQDIFPRLVRVVRRVIKSVDLTQTKHRTAVSIVGVFNQHLANNNSYFNIISNNQWQLIPCQSLSVMSASHYTFSNESTYVHTNLDSFDSVNVSDGIDPVCQ